MTGVIPVFFSIFRLICGGLCGDVFCVGIFIFVFLKYRYFGFFGPLSVCTGFPPTKIGRSIFNYFLLFLRSCSGFFFWNKGSLYFFIFFSQYSYFVLFWGLNQPFGRVFWGIFDLPWQLLIPGVIL